MLWLDATGAHVNAERSVHDEGVLPSLADAGCARRTQHGDQAQLLTIESNLHDRRPASARPVNAYGRDVQAHRSVAFTEVEITNGEDRLLAAAAHYS